MTDFTDPADVRAGIRAAFAGCDTDTAVVAIEQMRATHPGWADRIERESIVAGMADRRVAVLVADSPGRSAQVTKRGNSP